MRENTKGFITGKLEKFVKVMHSSLRSCYFEVSFKVLIQPNRVNTDTHLIWTLHYYAQFSFSLVKESPYIFSTFNPLNVDSPLYGHFL